MALAVAAAAGALCALLRVPLPWMIGPMLAVAAVRIAGWHIVGPPGGRQAAQWIIGTGLGLYFTPSVAADVGGIVWLLLVGALFAIALGYGCGFLLARLGGTDRTTAVFASVPGGAAEMAVLGERFGARVDQVAAAQSLRILMVVLVVPSVFAALRFRGADPFIAFEVFNSEMVAKRQAKCAGRHCWHCSPARRSRVWSCSTSACPTRSCWERSRSSFP